MDCNHARLLLSFYRDRTALDRSESDQLDEHLEHCPDCAPVAVAEQRFDEVLRPAMRAVPIPIGLKERLLSALPRPRPFWKRWTFAASAAAAVLLLAGGGIYLHFLLSPTPIQHVERTMQFPLLTATSKEPEVEAEIHKMEQWFREQKLAVAMPPPDEWKPTSLKAYTVGFFQSRRVPVLVFEEPGQQGEIRTGHIYVLSKPFAVDAFNPDSSLPTVTHTLQTLRPGNGFVFVVYSWITQTR